MSNSCMCQQPSDAYDSVCGKCLMPLNKTTSKERFKITEGKYLDDLLVGIRYGHIAIEKAQDVTITNKCTSCEALEQKLAVAVEALEFYGDCTRLMLDKNQKNHPLCKSISIADNGDTAREALAQIIPDAQKASEGDV